MNNKYRYIGGNPSSENFYIRSIINNFSEIEIDLLDLCAIYREYRERYMKEKKYIHIEEFSINFFQYHLEHIVDKDNISIKLMDWIMDAKILYSLEKYFLNEMDLNNFYLNKSSLYKNELYPENLIKWKAGFLVENIFNEDGSDFKDNKTPMEKLEFFDAFFYDIFNLSAKLATEENTTIELYEYNIYDLLNKYNNTEGQEQSKIYKDIINKKLRALDFFYTPQENLKNEFELRPNIIIPINPKNQALNSRIAFPINNNTLYINLAMNKYISYYKSKEIVEKNLEEDNDVNAFSLNKPKFTYYNDNIEVINIDGSIIWDDVAADEYEVIIYDTEMNELGNIITTTNRVNFSELGIVPDFDDIYNLYISANKDDLELSNSITFKFESEQYYNDRTELINNNELDSPEKQDFILNEFIKNTKWPAMPYIFNNYNKFSIDDELDNNNINLSWSINTNLIDSVDYYNVYLGEKPDELTIYIDTKNTNIEIPNLKYGQYYYYKIQSVKIIKDNSGKEIYKLFNESDVNEFVINNVLESIETVEIYGAKINHDKDMHILNSTKLECETCEDDCITSENIIFYDPIPVFKDNILYYQTKIGIKENVRNRYNVKIYLTKDNKTNIIFDKTFIERVDGIIFTAEEKPPYILKVRIDKPEYYDEIDLIDLNDELSIKPIDYNIYEETAYMPSIVQYNKWFDDYEMMKQEIDIYFKEFKNDEILGRMFVFIDGKESYLGERLISIENAYIYPGIQFICAPMGTFDKITFRNYDNKNDKLYYYSDKDYIFINRHNYFILKLVSGWTWETLQEYEEKYNTKIVLLDDKYKFIEFIKSKEQKDKELKWMDNALINDDDIFMGIDELYQLNYSPNHYHVLDDVLYSKPDYMLFHNKFEYENIYNGLKYKDYKKTYIGQQSTMMKTKVMQNIAKLEKLLRSYKEKYVANLDVEKLIRRLQYAINLDIRKLKIPITVKSEDYLCDPVEKSKEVEFDGFFEFEHVMYTRCDPVNTLSYNIHLNKQYMDIFTHFKIKLLNKDRISVYEKIHTDFNEMLTITFRSETIPNDIRYIICELYGAEDNLLDEKKYIVETLKPIAIHEDDFGNMFILRNKYYDKSSGQHELELLINYRDLTHIYLNRSLVKVNDDLYAGFAPLYSIEDIYVTMNIYDLDLTLLDEYSVNLQYDQEKIIEAIVNNDNNILITITDNNGNVYERWFKTYYKGPSTILQDERFNQIIKGDIIHCCGIEDHFIRSETHIQGESELNESEYLLVNENQKFRRSDIINFDKDYYGVLYIDYGKGSQPNENEIDGWENEDTYKIVSAYWSCNEEKIELYINVYDDLINKTYELGYFDFTNKKLHLYIEDVWVTFNYERVSYNNGQVIYGITEGYGKKIYYEDNVCKIINANGEIHYDFDLLETNKNNLLNYDLENSFIRIHIKKDEIYKLDEIEECTTLDNCSLLKGRPENILETIIPINDEENILNLMNLAHDRDLEIMSMQPIFEVEALSKRNLIPIKLAFLIDTSHTMVRRIKDVLTNIMDVVRYLKENDFVFEIGIFSALGYPLNYNIKRITNKNTTIEINRYFANLDLPIKWNEQFNDWTIIGKHQNEENIFKGILRLISYEDRTKDYDPKSKTYFDVMNIDNGHIITITDEPVQGDPFNPEDPHYIDDPKLWDYNLQYNKTNVINKLKEKSTLLHGFYYSTYESKILNKDSILYHNLYADLVKRIRGKNMFIKHSRKLIEFLNYLISTYENNNRLMYISYDAYIYNTDKIVIDKLSNIFDIYLTKNESKSNIFTNFLEGRREDKIKDINKFINEEDALLYNMIYHKVENKEDFENIKIKKWLKIRYRQDRGEITCWSHRKKFPWIKPKLRWICLTDVRYDETPYCISILDKEYDYNKHGDWWSDESRCNDICKEKTPTPPENLYVWMCFNNECHEVPKDFVDRFNIEWYSTQAECMIPCSEKEPKSIDKQLYLCYIPTGCIPIEQEYADLLGPNDYVFTTYAKCVKECQEHIPPNPNDPKYYVCEPQVHKCFERGQEIIGYISNERIFGNINSCIRYCEADEPPPPIPEPPEPDICINVDKIWLQEIRLECTNMVIYKLGGYVNLLFEKKYKLTWEATNTKTGEIIESFERDYLLHHIGGNIYQAKYERPISLVVKMEPYNEEELPEALQDRNDYHCRSINFSKNLPEENMELCKPHEPEEPVYGCWIPSWINIGYIESNDYTDLLSVQINPQFKYPVQLYPDVDYKYQIIITNIQDENDIIFKETKHLDSGLVLLNNMKILLNDNLRGYKVTVTLYDNNNICQTISNSIIRKKDDIKEKRYICELENEFCKEYLLEDIPSTFHKLNIPIYEHKSRCIANCKKTIMPNDCLINSTILFQKISETRTTTTYSILLKHNLTDIKIYETTIQLYDKDDNIIDMYKFDKRLLSSQPKIILADDITIPKDGFIMVQMYDKSMDCDPIFKSTEKEPYEIIEGEPCIITKLINTYDDTNKIMRISNNQKRYGINEAKILQQLRYDIDLDI